MLDELLEKILNLSQSDGLKAELQARLDEIRQLVHMYVDSGLVAYVRKVAARLNSPMFDDEISMLIGAAQDDLARLGVDVEIVREAKLPLVRLAITTYCKAHFGLDNTDFEKYLASYQTMADELRKSAAYRKAVG
ncbi:MAG: hypothetical protein FWE69_03820 [Clostridiales bacterium]|nr:hypothetical protein [Clostridiales bacterium]